MTVAPEITVAIATRDRPHELLRCLTALFDGSRLPAEVLVVDQSDDDETERMLAGCAAPVPLRCIRQPPLGLSASRNAAVACASTPILVVTDDDCVPDVGWVAAIADALAAPERPDVVTGAVLPLGPETPGTYPASLRTGSEVRHFRGRSVPWDVGTGANCAVRLDWYRRVGRYDERLGVGSVGQAAEDLDILYRLLRAGAVVRYEPRAVVLHERQTREQRLARRSSYGYGFGAFCGKWLRHRDAFALVMLVRWTVPRARRLVGGVVRARRDVIGEERRYLLGAAAGLLRGVRTR